jgi:nitrogen regulatory protein PII-like uncharacterized protein
MNRLIDYRVIGYSQSGEEGVLAQIMKILGIEHGLCCEFGAWDGKHLSNTRKLMEDGWRGLMIEADSERYKDLLKTYPPGSNAVSVCAYVDDADNSLAKLAARSNITERFDLISIDIDGLDYQIFSTLDQFSKPPLVVIVEVHTCHRSDDLRFVPKEIASLGCGQPLGLFIEKAREMGYRLANFIGTNAVFIHNDADHFDEIPEIAGHIAAKQNFDLILENKFAREYLYLCNIGKQQPGYVFDNPMFYRKPLRISFLRAAQLRLTGKI